MMTDHEKEKQSNWLLKLVVSITLVDMIATGLVVPTIPYYAKRLDMSGSTQGFLMSLYGILQLIGSPVLGKISDTWGRKVVLLMSVIGTCVSYSLLLYSSSLELFFVSRIVVGLLKNTETSCYSIITDISTQSTRVKRMAYIGSAIGLGFILGPAVSGLLTTSYSLETPAYMSSIMLILNIAITFAFLPETAKLKPDPDAGSTLTSDNMASPPVNSISDMSGDLSSLNDEIIDELGSPIDLLSHSSDALGASDEHVSTSHTVEREEQMSINDPSEVERLSVWNLLMKPNPLRGIVWLYFGTSMAVMIFQGSSILLFQLLGMTVQETSYIISYSGLLTVTSSFVIQWLSARYTDSQLLSYSILVVSMSLATTVFILAYPANTLVGLLIIFVPFTLGARTLKSCLLGAVTQHTPSSRTGTIIGVLNSLESLCRAVTPLFGGLLMDIFAGGPALAGCVLSLTFFLWIRHNPMLVRPAKSAS
jgi:MFS family permease